MTDTSASSAHTPAPWFDDGYRIHAPTQDADKRNGRLIVEYKHVDDFNSADARLIAAAPELLEACKKVFERLTPYPSSMTSWEKELSEVLNTVIAKAEGRAA